MDFEKPTAIWIGFELRTFCAPLREEPSVAVSPRLLFLPERCKGAAGIQTGAACENQAGKRAVDGFAKSVSLAPNARGSPVASHCKRKVYWVCLGFGLVKPWEGTKIRFVGIYAGESYVPGFLKGGAKWISSIHSMCNKNVFRLPSGFPLKQTKCWYPHKTRPYFCMVASHPRVSNHRN